eukprot:CAMPEP_0115881504 /NCGR_PEP_ID=MMETSP0287-20121206/28472_1 /TAXON_ID=412157 /ORGANISM="Chrysochromulina rotalis, Strain UIO044" /LENGTH=36 /DNA_ID= /DNA_START= /DNA_END= /DNA_ORIENTATION=
MASRSSASDVKRLRPAGMPCRPVAPEGLSITTSRLA